MTVRNRRGRSMTVVRQRKPSRVNHPQGIINALQAAGTHHRLTRKTNKRGANVPWEKRYANCRKAAP